jgi:hypothetical protein
MNKSSSQSATLKFLRMVIACEEQRTVGWSEGVEDNWVGGCRGRQPLWMTQRVGGGGEMICVCVEGRGVRVNRRRLGVGTCSKKLWNA